MPCIRTQWDYEHNGDLNEKPPFSEEREPKIRVEYDGASVEFFVDGKSSL